jgi:hypothetical protein
VVLDVIGLMTRFSG